MCRDAVIETTFDSAGWARVNDNGKLVGSDFGVAFPATNTVVHKIELFFGLPPFFWYSIDGIYPDGGTVLDTTYYDAIARGEIDLHADIIAPNSVWAWLKKQKLIVGAKTIPLRSSGNFPTAAWDASTLTTAPRHTVVKDIECPWKARKFVFDACDYTTYAVAAKEAPTCGANSVWVTGGNQAVRVVAFKGEWLPHKGLVADKSLPLCGFYKPTILAGRKNVFVGKYPILMEHDFINYIGEDQVIVCRDGEGQVNVLINTCRHRGNAVQTPSVAALPVFRYRYRARSASLHQTPDGLPLLQCI